MRFLMRILLLAVSLAWFQIYAQEQGPSPPEIPSSEASEPEEAPAQEERSMVWDAEWRGWDGFHYRRVYRFSHGKEVKGKHGVVNLDLSEVAYEGKIGGMFSVDGASFSEDRDALGKGSAWEVRRAKVYAAGQVVLLTPFSFRLEAGLAGGRFSMEKAYVQFEDRPLVGRIRIGQDQAPMGLEATSRSYDNLFMESSCASMALAPGTSAGLVIGKPVLGKRMVWSVGLLSAGLGENDFDASKDHIRAIGRLTGLAVDRTSAETPEWVHLGISASLLRSTSGRVHYRSRPESHLAPYLVDTGEMDAKDAATGCLEAAWVKGPCLIQGEYFHSEVKPASGGSLGFDGGYVQGSWFPTGESRPYNKEGGTLGRATPVRPFSLKGGGRGALELALRYSFVDLSDGFVEGGTMRSFSAGLNWNPITNAQVRLNWVVSRINRFGVESRTRILQIRMEIRF